VPSRPLYSVECPDILHKTLHNDSSFVAPIGGRNVSDEYFEAQFAFLAPGVLAIGAVVSDVSCDFERYWPGDASYRAEWILSDSNQAAVVRGHNARRTWCANPR